MECFNVGDRVEVRYKGEEMYYLANIIARNLDDTFDIEYDDGEKETGVSKDLIRVVGKWCQEIMTTSSDADQDYGWNPLIVAVNYHKTDIVNALITNTIIDQDIQDQYGNTALISGVWKGYEDIVR
eukprot:gene10349-21588_t